MINFQSKTDHLQTGHIDTPFSSCDLDLDPVTLIYQLDLDIVKMYLHTKNKVSRSRLSKLRA